MTAVAAVAAGSSVEESHYGLTTKPGPAGLQNCVGVLSEAEPEKASCRRHVFVTDAFKTTLREKALRLVHIIHHTLVLDRLLKRNSMNV